MQSLHLLSSGGRHEFTGGRPAEPGCIQWRRDPSQKKNLCRQKKKCGPGGNTLRKKGWARGWSRKGPGKMGGSNNGRATWKLRKTGKGGGGD